MVKSYSLAALLQQFINQGSSKRRRKADGGVLAKATLGTYINLKKIVDKYESHTGEALVIHDIRRATKREIERERKYWKKFYRSFSDFMYLELGHFDNYVGHNFKMLRAFFRWLNQEKGIYTGEFFKYFYAPKEEIPIITLEPEQLNFLIYDTEFEASLPRSLRQTKDIFVFGCTVALRFSDLNKLRRINWEEFNGNHYLSVVSKKTQIKTRVKLPDYAVAILNRYKKRSSLLLPVPHKLVFNTRIKKLMEVAGWTHSFPKYRTRRGKPVQIFKPNGKPYRFCDHFSSHSMRRTGITTLLRLGLNENLVRKVSGHTAGSKEFYKYVEISQSFMDEEIDIVHHKIGEKTLKITKNKELANS